MLIAHASLPADDPKRAAEILADIMQGQALPFPPGGPNSWMAWSGDGQIELEIVRRGEMLTYGEVEGEWRPAGPAPRGSESHLAICVDRPASEIIAIASEAGWPTRLCDRGGGYFQLVEVWVDGAFMIEFMDPAQTAHYQQAVTPAKWRAFLELMQPA